MYFTYDQFKQYVIEDLSTPIMINGVLKNKTRHAKMWDTLHPHFKNGSPVKIDNSNINKVFIWSDTHFGHANIIRYSNRPYKDANHMNSQLIDNYSQVVGADDIVIFVGDVGFMSSTRTNEILQSMVGYKILIVGNHDMHRGSHNAYKLDFDEIHASYVIDTPSHQLLLSHYPLTTVPDNCISVHGHTHTEPAYTPFHINVSVEQINYQPIPLQSIFTYAATL